jgi:hypothetical protein
VLLVDRWRVPPDECTFDGHGVAEDAYQWEKSCKYVDIGVVGDQDMSFHEYSCLPQELPTSLPSPPPVDLAVQSQSTITSHTCEFSTRLQTLSETVFAACGCDRLETCLIAARYVCALRK